MGSQTIQNNVFGDLPFIDPTKFITFFDAHRYTMHLTGPSQQ